MKKRHLFVFAAGLFLITEGNVLSVHAQEEPGPATEASPASESDSVYSIFDDTLLLEGYAKRYADYTKETLGAMIKDETLSPYRTAAAVRVFREKFSGEIFSAEKVKTEKILLRRLNRTDSPFVQVEIMHTLCSINRYHYFDAMVPALIQKLDHYNTTVNTIAFKALNEIIEAGHNRSREARIVFNILRKILFLMRRRLATIQTPDENLARKLKILRWSIKILGTEELKRLPKEILNLL